MASFYMKLPDEEFVRLSQEAFRNCRHPRDHARYLILKSLGLVSDDGPSPEKTNTHYDAKVSQAGNVTAGMVVNP